MELTNCTVALQGKQTNKHPSSPWRSNHQFLKDKSQLAELVTLCTKWLCFRSCLGSWGGFLRYRITIHHRPIEKNYLLGSLKMYVFLKYAPGDWWGEEDGGGLGSQPKNPWVRTMVMRSRFVMVLQRLFRCPNREVSYFTSLATTVILLYIGHSSN